MHLSPPSTAIVDTMICLDGVFCSDHHFTDYFKRKATKKQCHDQAAAHRRESIKSPDDYDNPEIALVTDHGLPEYDEWWIDLKIHWEYS